MKLTLESIDDNWKFITDKDESNELKRRSELGRKIMFFYLSKQL